MFYVFTKLQVVFIVHPLILWLHCSDDHVMNFARTLNYVNSALSLRFISQLFIKYYSLKSRFEFCTVDDSSCKTFYIKVIYRIIKYNISGNRYRRTDHLVALSTWCPDLECERSISMTRHSLWKFEREFIMIDDPTWYKKICLALIALRLLWRWYSMYILFRY